MKKKRKLKPISPRSWIKGKVQQIFLYSREHGQALKLTENHCDVCGVKKSQAKGRVVKLEVHHIVPARMNKIIDLIQEELLRQENLQPLCKPCHNKRHPDRIKKKTR
jgi:5-methylcytosine-specific restriction endonuclease McrA